MKMNLKLLAALFYTPAIWAQIITTVPFQTIPITPNDSFQAAYAFGAFHVILCYVDTPQNAGLLSWTFNNTPQSSPLPATLAINGNYQGSLADPSGILTFQNNQNFTITVSCVFAF